MKRKTYSASYARTEAGRRRSSARNSRPVPRKSGYGPIFFVVLVVTVASALGFMGVVASVLAGS